MNRPFSLVVLASIAGLSGSAAAADGDPEAQVFFREPDRETAARIGELFSRVATDSVEGRRRARRELEQIGWWSVAPLIDAAQNAEPGVRCASILVLDSIRDRRAVEPLRTVVVKEASHPFIAAFAALTLGRFRDPGAIESMRAAVKTSKTMEILKAAVPLAIARIRTPEAKELLAERMHNPAAKEQTVRNAALLAYGFFPDLALDASGSRPGPELASGLAAKQRRGERQAALLAFLVATSAKAETKPFLLEYLATETAPEVAGIALLGLSRSADADVTELLAKTALRASGDRTRIFAADLLLDRADVSVKPALLQIVRAPSASRLRASCLLSLGRVDDDEAQRTVLTALTDRSPLVRGAAAVASTRRSAPAARTAALAAIEARIRNGEPNDDVRANLEKARTVLATDRSDVRWTEIRPDKLFAELGISYEQRLLRAVNFRAQACLDLAKIHNLQNDAELSSMGPPTPTGDGGDDGEPSGGPPVDDGIDDPPPSAPPDDGGGGVPSSDGPAPGTPRTSQWQEQRDLLVELIRDPYFGAGDLPRSHVEPVGTPSLKK